MPVPQLFTHLLRDPHLWRKHTIGRKSAVRGHSIFSCISQDVIRRHCISFSHPQFKYRNTYSSKSIDWCVIIWLFEMIKWTFSIDEWVCARVKESVCKQSSYLLVCFIHSFMDEGLAFMFSFFLQEIYIALPSHSVLLSQVTLWGGLAKEDWETVPKSLNGIHG